MAIRKPRLTVRIARGLDAVYALCDVNQFDESDLYVGAKSAKERREINDAIAWLGSLLNWHKSKRKKRDKP